jgi:hypothetical protein
MDPALLSLGELCEPSRNLDRTSAADEVHDDRDQSEDKQQVDEEAADVQNEETAQPKQNKHNGQNKKHDDLLSWNRLARRARLYRSYELKYR